jgi:hypothetical protein
MSDPLLIEVPRFSARALACPNPATIRRLQTLRGMAYRCFGASTPSSDVQTPVFSLATIAFDGPIKYIEASLASMYGQTYPNMEFIIVDNASTGAVRQLVDSLVASDPRSRVIRTEENLFDPEAPDEVNPWPNLFSAALFLSSGDYFFGLSYDDQLSLNYAEKMTALFGGNPECTTAAPGVASINADSKENVDRTNTYVSRNVRPTYVPGIELARSLIRGAPMLVAPGEILSVRTDLAIELGGIDWMNDLSQVLRLSVTGVSGYDPSATLSWRHHEGQTNRALMRSGRVFYRDFVQMDARYGLSDLYRAKFGDADAIAVKRYLEKFALQLGTLNCIRLSSIEYGVVPGLRALRNALVECPPRTWPRCLGAFLRWAPEGEFKRLARGAKRALSGLLSKASSRTDGGK